MSLLGFLDGLQAVAPANSCITSFRLLLGQTGKIETSILLVNYSVHSKLSVYH